MKDKLAKQITSLIFKVREELNIYFIPTYAKRDPLTCSKLEKMMHQIWQLGKQVLLLVRTKQVAQSQKPKKLSCQIQMLQTT